MTQKYEAMFADCDLADIPAKVLQESDGALQDFLLGPKHDGPCEVVLKADNPNSSHCHICASITQQRHQRLKLATKAVHRQISMTKRKKAKVHAP